jgi:nucleotide-binding universal stress UspA family protein
MSRHDGLKNPVILCPVDFSKHSAHALRHAVEMARRFNGRLTVLFVNDPLLLIAASRLAGGQRRFLEQTLAELVRFVRRSSPPGASSEGDCQVTTGQPADEILRIARRLHTDVIVLGTRGLGGFQKLFFGSTTEQVLRRATIPVLAIAEGKGTRYRSLWPIERVVVPLDLEGEWRSDARRASTVAATFGAGLVLLHVVKPLQTPGWIRVDVAASTRQRVVRAHAVLSRLESALPPRARVSVRVVEGDPADLIARVASEPSSFVVMSLRGGAGVWGSRRGSVAYKVLARSGRPLLALPRRRLGCSWSARLRKTVDSVLRERDRIEMAGIDALLSPQPIRRRA